jgi:hypothetical protein
MQYLNPIFTPKPSLGIVPFSHLFVILTLVFLRFFQVFNENANRLIEKISTEKQEDIKTSPS